MTALDAAQCSPGPHSATDLTWLLHCQAHNSLYAGFAAGFLDRAAARDETRVRRNRPGGAVAAAAADHAELQQLGELCCLLLLGRISALQPACRILPCGHLICLRILGEAY